MKKLEYRDQISSVTPTQVCLERFYTLLGSSYPLVSSICKEPLHRQNSALLSNDVISLLSDLYMPDMEDFDNEFYSD